MTSLRHWALALLLPALAGCASAPPPSPDRAAATPDAAAVVARQSLALERVDYFKPFEKPGAGLEFTLAPLILREARSGAVTGPEESRAGLSQVSWAADTLTVGTQALPRFSYTWTCKNAPGQPDLVQGIRLTLNSAGQPILWEMLHDDSGLSLMFVAETLESAASKEFGGPLAGRRFAAEAALADAPRTIVARALQDGPVPMGPMVYLQAEGCSAHTVICRCMPAQAKQIATTSVYELLPAPPGSIAWPDPVLRFPSHP